jgi:hypothetical protein
MSCTAVIGISSQIQRLKKMIGPMTEKTVLSPFFGIFRHISVYGGVNCQGLSTLPLLERQVVSPKENLCSLYAPLIFIFYFLI